MAVLVRHDVLLGQWATAGAELGFEHLEEVGIEVGGLVRWAVERADITAGRSAAGLDLALEQPHPGGFVTAEQLLPDLVHRVAGGHHAALDEVVGVRAGPAFLQVETGLGLGGGPNLLLAQHRAGVDAEEQGQ